MPTLTPPAATSRRIAAAAATKLTELWAPKEPSAVTSDYLPDVDEVHRISGRQVYVVPAVRMSQTEAASRGQDAKLFEIAVLVAERYTGSGRPPRDWCHERLDFVEWLWNTLGETRVRLFPGELADVWSESSEIVVAYDAIELRTNKLYWAWLEFGFRRDE